MQVKRLVAMGLCCVGWLVLAGCQQSVPKTDRAIQRAVSYLVDHQQRLDPPLLVLIDYMSRRYQYTDLGEMARRLEAPAVGSPGQHDHADKQAAYGEAFHRLLDGRWRWPKSRLKDIPTEVDRLSLEGIYCDQWGLSPDFGKRALKQATEGGYATSHAPLAIAWATENGCLTKQQAAPLLEQLMPHFVELVERENVTTDVGMEMIAVLGYLGRGDVISPRWLQAILAAQRDDGGWANLRDPKQSNDHTTIVALWCLLHARDADRPAVSWIQRESR